MKPGEQFVAPIGFDRLDEAGRLNAVQHEHLWIVPVVFGMTAEEAARHDEGVQVVLDKEHLLAVAPIGCYTCEQAYVDVVGKPCPGVPE